MLAKCGAQHVLFAYQPVGPNVSRLLELIRRFPKTGFAAIVDNAATILTLSSAAKTHNSTLEFLLDLDCGMHRTGVAPDSRAIDLYRLLARSPGIVPGGLHAYDGHICDRNPAKRASTAMEAIAPVIDLRARLLALNLPVPRTVVGGTATLSVHARNPDIECSPGTCVLWDAGYESLFPDLGFHSAAAVLARVVSTLPGNRLCLDLGYKAIAAESPSPCVKFFGLSGATIAMQNEEHLVLETPHAEEYKPGDVLYGIPWHICPTVAMHDRVAVIRSNRWTATWKVEARDRILTI